LGEGHPEYATSLNNLAVLYRAMGRHGEAEPLSLKAESILRSTLGTQHPKYLDIKNRNINIDAKPPSKQTGNGAGPGGMGI
jgi:hypothetical protein